jgi:hypothetical protein
VTTTLAPSTSGAPPAAAPRESAATLRGLASYALAGLALGIVLVKSEVIFWHRIHEMFRFESFHMYGVLGSAFVTAFVSLRLLRRLSARSRTGEVVALEPKAMNRGHRYWLGGAIFGIGWALCGACPGPLFALIGSGRSVYVVTLMAALAGTWTYGMLRSRLPH